MPTVPPDQFNFCGPTFLAASPVIDNEDSLNLYPELEYKSSKSGVGLIGRPGFSPTPYITLPNSPVRGLWAGNNRLFAVGGTHLFEVNAGGGITTDYGAMAISANAGNVQIIANGTQLLVCDPRSPGSHIYLANTLGPAMTPVFTGTALEYLDNFYVAIASGGSLAGANPNQINVSNNGDGSTWNALNFVLRTGAADLTTQLAVLNGQLWIFGQKTIEIWYDAGNPGFPFSRIQGATINLGLLSSQSVVKFYNTIMWVGADDRGYAQVYMAQGLNPVRVSNAGIESFLVGALPAVAPDGLMWAYGYQEGGHTFYVLNLISAGGNVPDSQLVYDLTTGLWHRRAYAAAFPISFASLPGFYGDANLIGDGKSGKIYGQSLLYPNDGTGNAITYTRTAPHLSATNKWLKHSRFELDGDFGTAAPTLDYSDDGGRNFGGRTIALRQAADQGRGTVSPTFRRFFALQLGRSRDRVYKVTCTDNANLIRIANAYLDVAA